MASFSSDPIVLRMSRWTLDLDPFNGESSPGKKKKHAGLLFNYTSAGLKTGLSLASTFQEEAENKQKIENGHRNYASEY